MRIAIIDLGTNIFNLIVVETNNEKQYQIIHESKYAAKLGSGGINNKTMTDEAFDRGIEALKKIDEVVKRVNVEKTLGIATSAIRNASNGKFFVEYVKKNLAIDIKIIDGNKEAGLIFDGVKQVVPICDEKVMILDIGGGSNEFIIANKNGIIWKRSFELGMARMLDKFKPSDPITMEEIERIENYFGNELVLLFDELKKHQVITLIGSAGPFDTIAEMIALMVHPHLDFSKLTSYLISIDNFNTLHKVLLSSSMDERASMERMDPDRLEMIVLASIFINFIVRECGIEEMWQCKFSLKEGAIHQIINNQL